jgi:hypothetical protein
LGSSARSTSGVGSSSASFAAGVLSTLAISRVSTTSGAAGGVGERSTFRRFGSTISPSSSSSSSRACLRPDAGEDDDGGDESGPGAVAGVGVRGHGSVVGVGAGAGVADVGGDAENARAGGDSVGSIIGYGVGVVEADGEILHVHFSMNYHGRIYILKHELPQGITKDGTYLCHFRKFSLEVHAHPPLTLKIVYACCVAHIPARSARTHTPKVTHSHCFSSFCDLRSICTNCMRSACMRCRMSARVFRSFAERARSF